jgi:hypothetical protein
MTSAGDLRRPQFEYGHTPTKSFFLHPTGPQNGTHGVSPTNLKGRKARRWVPKRQRPAFAD